jgi:hypothetical protein
MEISCDLCPAKFGHVVELDFHYRREHPGAADASRAVLRTLYRQERLSNRPAASDRLNPKLEQLYRRGCPCGRSLNAHLVARRRLGAA